MRRFLAQAFISKFYRYSMFKLRDDQRQRPINILLIRTHACIRREAPLREIVNSFLISPISPLLNYLLPFALYLVSLRPPGHAPFIRTVRQTCEKSSRSFSKRVPRGKNIGSSAPEKSPASRPVPLEGFLINS